MLYCHDFFSLDLVESFVKVKVFETLNAGWLSRYYSGVYFKFIKQLFQWIALKRI